MLKSTSLGKFVCLSYLSLPLTSYPVIESKEVRWNTV